MEAVSGQGRERAIGTSLVQSNCGNVYIDGQQFTSNDARLGYNNTSTITFSHLDVSRTYKNYIYTWILTKK